MALSLVFKRSKAFVTQTVDGGTKKFLASANPSAAVSVPNWVADTPTFHHGVKDGSIVNLTPPHLMPGYKAPVAAVDEQAEEPVTEAAKEEDAQASQEEEVEQTEVPQAPFGGQPMTPVPPAPRVGSVRASSRAR